MSSHLDIPDLNFAPARDARLAYQQFGSGEHTIVGIPPTAQNIEVAWEQPQVRAMLARFSTFCRYVHFDKRGTGCSDRRGRVADLDERVEDLRAVMDHAGIERAHLFGQSEGGPMTLLFAATYPDRVDGVILLGSGASLYPAGLTDEQHAALRQGARAFAAVWGTPDSPVAAGFAPTLHASDPGFATWHQRYERLSASQDSLLELLELGFRMDVRELLADLEVPVLVLHRTGDRIVPVERGRETAAAIPGARLVELPGEDHFGYAGDVEAWMRPAEQFVTGRLSGGSAPTAAPTTPGSQRRPAVQIVTLGRFAVEVAGQPVPTAAWGSRRARTLCKRLVAARGWPVTRDELFELLWPDERDRGRLGARLSVQLSTVRKILQGGVIADRQSVRLDLDEVDTDLEALHRAPNDDAIVVAYPGEFLPDERYEAWTDATRDEARRHFVRAAHRLAREHLDEHPATAVDLAERLLSAERYDEQAHRLLVIALQRTGATGEARRAHRAWQQAMGELDLPVPAYDEVVDQAPAGGG